MKEIHVAFPPAFSRIMCFEADGVKYINENFKYEESAPASPNHEQSKSAQPQPVVTVIVPRQPPGIKRRNCDESRHRLQPAEGGGHR